MLHIKPNKGKVLRDIIIIDVLILVGTFVTAGITAQAFLFTGPFMLMLSALYMAIMGVLPYVRITESGELQYRSDYGVTHKINLSDIKRLTKGSGLGGYEHALFVYFSKGPGQERRVKIKSRYFDRDQIVELVTLVRGNVQVQINDELEKYLSGRIKPN